MKKIIILMPYFGMWPKWINLYMESCKYNPEIDWLFFTDNDPPINICKNVKFIKLSLQEFIEMSSQKLDIHPTWNNAYKICDLRPGFAIIFSEYIKGYDYWGWGDVDVIYGNIRPYIENILKYDVISFKRNHVNGHLNLFRNTSSVNNLYLNIPKWKEKMEDHNNTGINEKGMYEVVDVKSNYFVESYNTPDSGYVPWIDGSWAFPRVWHWKDGILTNDKDKGKAFLYLHFQYWKYNWKSEDIIHLDDVFLEDGFYITPKGFFNNEKIKVFLSIRNKWRANYNYDYCKKKIKFWFK